MKLTYTKDGGLQQRPPRYSIQVLYSTLGKHFLFFVGLVFSPNTQHARIEKVQQAPTRVATTLASSSSSSYKYSSAF
jgi:hypothetical protein